MENKTTQNAGTRVAIAELKQAIEWMKLVQVGAFKTGPNQSDKAAARNAMKGCIEAIAGMRQALAALEAE